MLRAALIPYGKTGLVIGDDAVRPCAVLHVEEHAIGKLVRREPNEQGPSMRREITREHAEELAAKLVTTLRAHKVERLAIESQEGDGPAAVTARVIGEPVAAAARLAGVVVVFIDSATWRATSAGKDKTPTKTNRVSVAEQATALLGFDVDPVAPVTLTDELAASVVAVGAELERRNQIRATFGLPPLAQAPAAEPEPAHAEEEDHAASEPAAERPPAVCGVDPGSAFVGVACVPVASLERRRDTGTPLELAHMTTIEVGALVEGKRVFNDADVSTVLEQFGRVLTEQNVSRVVLEWAPFQYAGADRDLLRSQFIAGAIRGLCYARGIEVRTIVESTWHAAATQWAPKRQDRVAKLGGALAAAYARWPAQSNQHVRDAAGVLLAETTEKVRAKVAKDKPTIKTVASPKRDKNAARKARAAKAREGCTCNGRRRHALTCPRYVPT